MRTKSGLARENRSPNPDPIGSVRGSEKVLGATIRPGDSFDLDGGFALAGGVGQ